jgi:hypothetical protein
MKPVHQKASTRKKRAKKSGRKAGHPGSRRAVPEQIDERKSHRAKCCPHCQGKLKRCAATRTRYTEDIPEDITPVVTEHTIHRDWCPRCNLVLVLVLGLREYEYEYEYDSIRSPAVSNSQSTVTRTFNLQTAKLLRQFETGPVNRNTTTSVAKLLPIFLFIERSLRQRPFYSYSYSYSYSCSVRAGRDRARVGVRVGVRVRAPNGTYPNY